MEASDLPPLPTIKKRKPKAGKRGNMNRSRSFVAEMFHIKNPTNTTKKWSNNDMQLLAKLGISPNHDRNDRNNRNNSKISPNLHPDLKQHAYEEQINSLQIELQESKNNLMRAAEYGQHLIEENQRLESMVLELRNEAAEYIAQLCELREENDTFQLSLQNNEYSVSEYENKMYEFKSDKDELNDKLISLQAQLNEFKYKYEMEENKCKLYQNQADKYQAEKNNISTQYDTDIQQLETQILVLQNTNHKLLLERDEIKKKYHKTTQEMNALHHEYNEICSQYKPHTDLQDATASSISGDSRHRFTNISRRRSHSRSRSDKREDLEEKMDEIVNENEYKTDNNKYTDILLECMHLFENIMDDQHISSPIKLTNTLNERIDMELFKDLMGNVQEKLKNDKYGGDIKRNISELRRNSKSNSNMETFDCYILSSEEKEEEDIVEVGDIVIEYEADNEDLDNLPNKSMLIEPIDEKQKQCVEEFLVRYSENNSWNNCGEDEYELEIEFNENINLENKKKNNISISASLLQSLTDLIENIMGITSSVNVGDYGAYFSICGWFCGKSAVGGNINDYSRHYLDILSALDYNAENREEIYWVIYQLLNVIYKYYNHTQKSSNVLDDNFKSKDFIAIGENVSDSESMSMVMTQTKSKYAELKPPKRRRDKKILNKKKSRAHASFHPLNNISSEDDDI